jgi:RES domain-containing protein
VYCAPNPATALLEILVHAEIDVEDIPVKFRYLEIDAPDSVAVETTENHSLGPGWQKHLETTRRVGDDWLRSGRTALFRVPSVIVPATWNILVNPQHQDSARIRIVHVHEQGVDPRLLR